MINSAIKPPVQIGIIGAGWVAGDRHIPAFKGNKLCDVSVVLDRNIDRAKETAKKYRIPRYISDLDSFLKEPLDAVSICTPPGEHGHLIEAAINAGKHVLVEKPMTLTSGEGKALAQMAKNLAVILCPAHSFLFSRSMLRAKSVIASGKAGRVRWATGIQLSSWRRRLPSWFDDLPGGLFFDEAPHFLYLMKYFLGELNVDQAWFHSGMIDSRPDERLEARLTGSRGNGQLTMWTGSPFSEWQFILFCSKAVLVLDLFRDILILLPPEKAHNAKDVLKLSANGTLQLWKEIGITGLRLFKKRLFFGHDHLVNMFLEAIIRGEESPVATDDGYEIVALFEKILNASSRKKDK